MQGGSGLILIPIMLSCYHILLTSLPTTCVGAPSMWMPESFACLPCPPQIRHWEQVFCYYPAYDNFQYCDYRHTSALVVPRRHINYNTKDRWLNLWYHECEHSNLSRTFLEACRWIFSTPDNGYPFLHSDCSSWSKFIVKLQRQRVLRASSSENGI